MPTIEHSTLTTTDLHEPKGVASATANDVYVADGAGSGAWTPRRDFVHGRLADVSTASTIYVPILYAGSVVKATCVIDGAIATGDTTITIKNSAAATMGTITITQSGSAAGDVDTVAISTNNTVTDDDYITIETNGASTNTVAATFTLVIEES